MAKWPGHAEESSVSPGRSAFGDEPTQQEVLAAANAHGMRAPGICVHPSRASSCVNGDDRSGIKRELTKPVAELPNAPLISVRTTMRTRRRRSVSRAPLAGVVNHHFIRSKSAEIGCASLVNCMVIMRLQQVIADSVAGSGGDYEHNIGEGDMLAACGLIERSRTELPLPACRLKLSAVMAGSESW